MIGLTELSNVSIKKKAVWEAQEILHATKDIEELYVNLVIYRVITLIINEVIIKIFSVENAKKLCIMLLN